MTVTEKLKKLRAEKHFSEKDIAAILGIRVNEYSRIEKGISRLSDFTRNQLASLYSVSPDYLKDDIPEPEPIVEPEPEPVIESAVETRSEPIPETGTESIEKRRSIMTFGEKVKALRLSKNLTAKELTDLLPNYTPDASLPTAMEKMEEKKEQSVSVNENAETVEAAVETGKKVVQISVNGKVKKAVAKDPKDSVESKLDSILEELKTEEEKAAPSEKESKSKAVEPIKESEPVKESTPDEEKSVNIPFGKKLNTLRKEKGLTLAQVADKIGVTLGSYKGMEYRNSRPMTMREYRRLAKTLGCEVDYLTEGDLRYDKSADVPKKKVVIIPATKVVERAGKKKPAPVESTPTEDEMEITPVEDEIEIEITPEDIRRRALIEKVSKDLVFDPDELMKMPMDEIDADDDFEATMAEEIKDEAVRSEVIKMVSRLSVLLSGDEISQKEKDAVMLSLNGAYWGSR